MLNSLRYTIKQAFGQVLRNKTMSIASVFSITAMLLILGIFFILVININMVTESVKADYDTIEVFMLEDSTEEEIRQETRRACEAYGHLKGFWPGVTYGGPGTLYPHVEPIVIDEIARYNQEHFGVSIL